MTKLFNKLKKNIYILAIFGAKFFYPENSAVKHNLRKHPGRPCFIGSFQLPPGVLNSQVQSKKNPVENRLFFSIKKTSTESWYPRNVSCSYAKSQFYSLEFQFFPLTLVFFLSWLFFLVWRSSFLQISDLNHPQYIFLFSSAWKIISS